MKHYNAGKGDTQRPTDQQKYADNYDLIFGKKPQDATTTPTPRVVEQNPPKKQ